MSTLNTAKLAGAAAAALLLTGSSVAFAQTTYDASGATSTDMSSTTDASSTAGVPNTGAGGNAAGNIALLLTAGVAAAGAGAYLLRQRAVI